MIAALDITLSYSETKTVKDRLEDDNRVRKNQQEFVQGAKFGFQIYSIYLLVGQARSVCAKEIVPSKPPSQNQPIPGAGNPNPPKPGLSDTQKGVFTGSATGICGLALQTSNFWLGVACVGLLIIGSKVVGAPSPTPSP